jgi:hypothetical protein
VIGLNKKSTIKSKNFKDPSTLQKSNTQLAQKSKTDFSNELKVPLQDSLDYKIPKRTSNTSLVIEDFDYTNNTSENFEALDRFNKYQFNDSIDEDDQDEEDIDENEEYYENFELNKMKLSEKDDDDDDDKEDETQAQPNNSFQNSGCEVRIDLINDIKGEFLETDSSTQFLNNSSSNFEQKNLTSQTDLKYNYSKDEEDEEDDEEYDKNTEAMSNLSNLRICIDEIEELVDKSNKTCFVFVIQVWNLQPLLEHAAAEKLKSEQNNIQDPNASINSFSEELPTWSVKRKYDEFYVLDSKLKEFHGELISSNNEYNINNQNQITVQLPSKQRAVFLIANTKAQIEFLNSVKNDFTKYLQVKKIIIVIIIYKYILFFIFSLF